MEAKVSRTTRSLWNILRGYVTISIKGSRAAELVSALAAEEIPLWEVRRTAPDELSARIAAGDFRRIRGAAFQTRSRVRILRRHGLPFALAAFRFRPALLWGALLFAAALFALSCFVWRIEVTGCLNTDPAAVRAALKEEGVAPGVPAGSIALSGLGNRLVSRLAGVAWAGVTLNGSQLTVSIVEDEAVQEAEEGGPSSIVADRSGVLSQVVVYEGTALLQEGDRVEEGQVIVEGRYPNAASGEPRLAHARAQLECRVWYTARARAAYASVQPVRTGRQESVTVVRVGGMESASPSEFSNYDAERTLAYELKGFFLPFSVFTEVRHELAGRTVARTAEECRAEAEAAAWQKLAAQLPKDAVVTQSETSFYQDGAGVWAIVVAETRQPIGQSVPYASTSPTGEGP